MAFYLTDEDSPKKENGKIIMRNSKHNFHMDIYQSVQSYIQTVIWDMTHTVGYIIAINQVIRLNDIYHWGTDHML